MTQPIEKLAGRASDEAHAEFYDLLVDAAAELELAPPVQTVREEKREAA